MIPDFETFPHNRGNETFRNENQKIWKKKNTHWAEYEIREMVPTYQTHKPLL